MRSHSAAYRRPIDGVAVMAVTSAVFAAVDIGVVVVVSTMLTMMMWRSRTRYRTPIHNALRPAVIWDWILEFPID